MIRLIGLLGSKGCGKDTLAKLLITRLSFVRISFATALYCEVANAYGVSVAFLENRDTKETPLPELALFQCNDMVFRDVARRAIIAEKGRFDWQELFVPRSPRWTLQLWGTEYRRAAAGGYDAYLIDQVKNHIQNNPSTRFVITDVRFLNEASMVREFEGALIRVRRPALEAKEAEARANGALTALHPSETQMLKYPVDFEVVNLEGQPEGLVRGMSRFLPELDKVA